MNIKIVDLIILPQHDLGVDWGTKRKLICRIGDKQLWHEGGCSYWSGIGNTSYSPANWCLYGGTYRNKTSVDGRFSMKWVREHRDQINDFFGVDVVDTILKGKLKKTVVVAGEGGE